MVNGKKDIGVVVHCYGRGKGKRFSSEYALPKNKRSLVDRETPPWNIKKMPDIGYVRVAPEVESYKPDCDTFKPK